MGSDGFAILSVSIIRWVRGYLQVEMKSTDIRSYLRDEDSRHLYNLPLHTGILSKSLTLHIRSIV